MRALAALTAVLVLSLAAGCLGDPDADSLQQQAKAAPALASTAEVGHDGGADPGGHDGGWNGWHTCEDKVVICHVPPGNPGNRHNITISFCDLEDHFAHGDLQGPDGAPLPCP